jgi:hypothetical protein
MSRSKHTDPRLIRATRRIQAPFEPRSTGDLRRRRELGSMLKELEAIPRQGDNAKPRILHLRIITRQPNSGFHHPVGKNEVLGFLKSLGSLAIYGLRIIELARSPAPTDVTSMVFGRYEVPGRILLIEQPASPWRLPGILKHADMDRLERSGAIITAHLGLRMTLVEWPDNSLKRFMLEEVLLHELGHHILQHHKGKRPARIARTKDHEASAERFAIRQRSLLRDAKTYSK